MDTPFILTTAIAIFAVVVPVYMAIRFRRQDNEVHKIVIVDDDFAVNEEYKNIFYIYFTEYEINFFENPEKAIRYIRSGKNIRLCIIDMVYRASDSMAGVKLV